MRYLDLADLFDTRKVVWQGLLTFLLNTLEPTVITSERWSRATDMRGLRFVLVGIAYTSLARRASRVGVGAGSSILGLEAFLLGQLIVQHHIEERLVNMDTPVVIDISKFSKAIHEKAHARSGRTDHIG